MLARTTYCRRASFPVSHDPYICCSVFCICVQYFISVVKESNFFKAHPFSASSCIALKSSDACSSGARNILSCTHATCTTSKVSNVQRGRFCSLAQIGNVRLRENSGRICLTALASHFTVLPLAWTPLLQRLVNMLSSCHPVEWCC